MPRFGFASACLVQKDDGTRRIRIADEDYNVVEWSAEPLAEPWEGAASRGKLTGEFYVIGVYGDDWMIVMTEDGTVEYVRSGDLWAGNG